MKASDYIASALHRHGVKQVFEVSGGMITHLLDSIHQLGQIRLVSVHHEQAAAFAAEAVGRMTGIPGVAMATSGPGATNLLTGVASCFFDSSPAVFLTGQVNRDEQKGSRAIRQLGFQETDIVQMAGSVTKAAWKVASVEELPDLIERAFSLATRGRPGPVLIDIPMDVQRMTVPGTFAIEQPVAAALPNVEPALAKLRDASRPLVLVGGGIRSARVTELLRKLVNVLGIPVVASLMAVDVLPHDHPLRVGMIGSYGNRWANMAVSQSDCLLVLGSRLDVRQTGADTDAFMADRSVLHVDCEPGEINNRVTGCVSIVSELPAFLSVALATASRLSFPDRRYWFQLIAEWRTKWPDTDELEGVPGINPNIFMHRLSAQSSTAAAFAVDVGQHQMWACQSLDL